jgi:hypothetical protein
MQNGRPTTIEQLREKITAAYDSITREEIIDAFYGERNGLLVISFKLV